MNKKVLSFACMLVLFAAISRLLPHPPNFTPILAMGLFAGAYFNKKFLTILIPLAAMFLADTALHTAYLSGFREFAGFHSALFPIYGIIALIAMIGWSLKDRVSVLNVGVFSLFASILFFILSNLAVWGTSGFYPMDFNGLIACYTAAIPFFGNTLISTLAYSALLFGTFEYFKSTQAKQTSIQ